MDSILRKIVFFSTFVKSVFFKGSIHLTRLYVCFKIYLGDTNFGLLFLCTGYWAFLLVLLFSLNMCSVEFYLLGSRIWILLEKIFINYKASISDYQTKYSECLN